MIKNIKNYGRKIYILRDLIRYNNSFHIKTESVAEHQNFVTLFVIELHSYYRFNLEKAMIMAATHDLSETVITDIPHNVKRRFPEIANEIKKAEHKVVSKDFGLTIYNHFEELEEGQTVEAKIVMLADVLSCLQYSESEILLGNTGYMKIVYDESIERINMITKELEECKK